MLMYPADIAFPVVLVALSLIAGWRRRKRGPSGASAAALRRSAKASVAPILFLCGLAAIPLVGGGTVYLAPAQDALRSLVEPGRAPGIPLHRTTLGLGLLIFAASFALDALCKLRRARALERAVAKENAERFSRERWG